MWGHAAEHQRIERVWCVRWIFSLTGTNSTLTGRNTKSFRELAAAEIARLTFETVVIREFKRKQQGSRKPVRQARILARFKSKI